MPSARIETRAGLSEAEYADVVRLRDACEAAGGLDLKLELSRAEVSTAANTLLAYAGDILAGYCGIDAGREAEVCGIVHPEHRRRGIGTALLDGILALDTPRGGGGVLVICEDASAIAMAWLRRRGATLHQSEYRMVLRLEDAPSPAAATLQLRAARREDRADLVRLLVDAFGESPAATGERLDRSLNAPGEETLVGFAGDRMVATTRLTSRDRRAMIYGFVVDPALRGQGHGRAMMHASLALLRARGVPEVGLEVETDNAAAVRLYRSSGFRIITTYRYMRLPV